LVSVSFHKPLGNFNFIFQHHNLRTGKVGSYGSVASFNIIPSERLLLFKFIVIGRELIRYHYIPHKGRGEIGFALSLYLGEISNSQRRRWWRAPARRPGGTRNRRCRVYGWLSCFDSAHTPHCHCRTCSGNPPFRMAVICHAEAWVTGINPVMTNYFGFRAFPFFVPPL
jgi:hypothetical protein